MTPGGVWSRVRRLPASGLIFVIELYRSYVSPTRMPTCRFTPTCSEYAVTALRSHGVLRGTVLSVMRLLKCAPWHPGGWDPVPERHPPRSVEPDQHASGHRESVATIEQRST